MSQKPISPTPRLPGSALGLVEWARALAWSAFRRLPGRPAKRANAPRSEERGRSAAENTDEGSTLLLPSTKIGDGLSRFGRLGAWVAKALKFRSSSAGFFLQEPGREEDALERLARNTEPRLQRAILTEALALLDEFDRRVIALRMTGASYASIARVLEVDTDAAGPRYALAVDRLRDRLSWVAALERRGISPPEREALGHVRFFGRTAQEVALLLRLNQEAVERWVRLSERSQGPEHGVRR